METNIETQLSFELQEIYLENKEWLSNILFLEDEMRFFQQILKKAIGFSIKQSDLEKIDCIQLNLTTLQERTDDLKRKLDNRQEILQSMLKDEVKTITIDFIEEDTAIVTEIKVLLAIDKVVKNELFALIEGLQVKEKIQKYPIL